MSKLLFRAIIASVCSVPVLLLMLSLVAVFAGTTRPSDAGVGFMIAASLIVAFNFGLAFLRPWWIKKQRGTLEGVRHVSGIPMLGSLLLLIGGVAGFGNVGIALWGLVLAVLDVGGLPWLLIAVWQDDSFWRSSDSPSPPEGA